MTDATPARETPPAAVSHTYKVVVLLALGGLFAYYNSLRGAFVFDDVGNIVLDTKLGTPLAGVLATRPVASLTLTLNYRLDGLNVRGYHLANLAIHYCAALAFYGLVRRTLLLDRFGGKFVGRAEVIAGLIAAVWFLHPIQTQAVTYVVQRCESLMGMFFLLTLYCFVRGATASVRNGVWYTLAVVCCALGAGCKEMMVAAPPVALLYDRAYLAGSFREAVRRRWRVYLPLCVPPAIGAAYILFGGLLSDEKGTVGFGVKAFTPVTYALTQVEVVPYYLRLILWPDNLCLDYIDWPAPQSLAAVWPSAVALGGLLAATAYGVAVRAWWGVPAAAFFLILAPTSTVIPLQDAVFEHRLYLPLAGVLLVLAGGVLYAVERLPARVAAAVGVAVGCLAVGLGFATVLRNEAYATPLAVWSDVVAKRPGNYRARGAMAGEMLGAGRVDEAEKEARRALTDFPSSPTNIRMYGYILLEKKPEPGKEAAQLEQAAVLFQNLLKEMPTDPQLRLWLGICRLIQNRPADAAEQFKAGTDLAPNDVAIRVGFATALRKLNRPSDADAELARVTRADPGYAKQLAGLARRLAFEPDAGPAKLAYAAVQASAASRLAKDANPEYLDTLAMVQARTGDFAAAAATAENAAAKAAAAGDDYLAARVRRRADLYRAKKPYLADSLAD